VRELAAAYPNGSISLVGPLQDPDYLRPLYSCPNVGFYPPVDRLQLTGVVAAADACLIPHVRNPLTEAMSPLKLYEYLAGGRPVAAVDLPPIIGVSDRVALAPAGSTLVPAVERSLALGPASEADRIAFILENGWETRFDEVLEVALAD
jgi:teichuronic acid biosynthesis glycosyltransferase TuaH